MDELSFGNPEVAWLGLAVVAMAVWGWLRIRRFERGLSRLGKGPVVRRLVASFAPGRALTREVVVALGMLLLIGAAMRPRYGLRETEVSNSGIDIVFAVDASKSMLVRDIVPNRLKGTILEISGLLDRLAGGRVALVPFAGIPFVQCPLTTDHDVVRTYLAELKPDDMPVGGTNLGRAITAATEVLTGTVATAEAELQGNLVPQFKGSKHKAIVLFSDGEDHEGDAVEAAKKAAAQGIRVYTVGVGSSFGDPVPIVAADGSVTGTLKDEQGSPIFSKLNLELLGQIATASGGKSLHYANKTVVPELFAALDALEKAEYRERFKMLGEDRFQWLLGPALLLLLLALALGVRTPTAKGPVATTPTVKRASGAAMVLALLSVAAMLLTPLPARAVASVPAGAANAASGPPTASPPAAGNDATKGTKRAAVDVDERSQAERRHDPNWLDRENPDVKRGREAIADGKANDALAAFEEAQRSRPEHAVLWYDVGLVQAILGLHSGASVAFGRALSAMEESDAELEADLHFAAGTSQIQWGQVIEAKAAAEGQQNAGGAAPAAGTPGPDDAPPTANPGAVEDPADHYRLAVESLQKALVAAPGREDIRRNLEIAVLLAYPPCERRDKAFEPNDQPAMAKPLELDEKKKETEFELRACPLDRDVLSLDLQPGDRLTAKITLAEETEKRAIDPLLGGTSGDRKLALRLLDATGTTILRGGEPPAPTVEEVQLTAAGRPERVLLDIRNVGGVETPYKLAVKVLPDCRRLEDAYEPNDTPATARAVPIGQPLALRICPRNEDHLAVALQRGQGLMVRAKRTLDLGSDVFEIAVLDPAGRVVGRARAQGEGWIARLAFAQVSGDYVVRIRGGIDTEADVELVTEVTPPCAQRDDAYEENDAAIAANPMDPAQLSAPIEGLQLCPGDDDWFQVELKAGESLFVDLVASIEELPDIPSLAGSVTVTVFDAAGEIWGEGRGGPLAGDAKALTRTTAVLAPPPGIYWVRVTGGGVAAPIFPLPPLPDGAEIVESDAPAPQGADGSDDAAAGQMAPQGGIMATPQGRGPPPGTAGSPGGTAPAPTATAPKKIKHVMLPPGYPMPLVQQGSALVDLPYRLGLRVLPPCPDGNDEHEPNNTAAEAKRIEVGQEQLFRICKGDQDWIEIEQKADQNLAVSARYDYAHGTLNLRATDEGGTTELAKGETAAPQLPSRTANAKGQAAGANHEDTPAARRGRTAVSSVGVAGDKKDRVVKVQVVHSAEDGENFYILRVEEPPPPSDKPNPDQQKDDKDDKDDEKKDGDKKPDPKKDEKKDEKQDEKEAEQKQQKQQMQRHDKNPKNLEALEALRKSPFRNQRPTRDW